ncbi:MAG: tripartite tricarboxylate transporter substrate binding protein [Betaproteobacteria bacterium]|nr:tripartite tricarboxylate transporter substrate binding protein [Betaproteobacteria bacterium]
MGANCNSTRFVRIAALVIAPLVGTAVNAGAARAQAWQPERAVEIIVGTSPGGGQDRSTRFVQKLIQDNKLVAVPTAVVNKPGAGSSIAYTYLNQQAGNAHHIMLLTVPLLTNYITGISPISHADLTPLSTLFDDYIVATVTPDSPIKSASDLMDRIKKDPSSVSVGIPSITGGGGLAILLAAKGAGIDPKQVKTVVFKSGGDSVSALLGGHVDVMMSTTAAPVAQLKAGKVRILGIASPKRLHGMLATVPTLSEQGVKVVFSNWRGIVGPKGLSPAQIAYWEGVFARLIQIDEFKKDVERRFWVSNYRDSAGMARFLKAQHEVLTGLLRDLGMAKR